MFIEDLPPHVQRMIAEYNQVKENVNKASAFLAQEQNRETAVAGIPEDEWNDLRDQTQGYRLVLRHLGSRLKRAGVDLESFSEDHNWIIAAPL